LKKLSISIDWKEPSLIQIGKNRNNEIVSKPKGWQLSIKKQLMDPPLWFFRKSLFLDGGPGSLLNVVLSVVFTIFLNTNSIVFWICKRNGLFLVAIKLNKWIRNYA